jgi:hypothetical protein
MLCQRPTDTAWRRPVLKNPISGQGFADFDLKNPIFGQGFGQISTSKTQFFGQPLSGASRGLWLSSRRKTSTLPPPSTSATPVLTTSARVHPNAPLDAHLAYACTSHFKTIHYRCSHELNARRHVQAPRRTAQDATARPTRYACCSYSLYDLLIIILTPG